MTLTPAFLDELRARTSLSDLVGKTVKLQRAGREMRGCCPFHQEKTPSFYVNDDKGFYHCFGCSAHGDAIRWMTEQRGLPFMDAVKELAATAGMDVPAPDPRAAARQERAKGLHEAMADAAAWFAEQLHGVAGAEARAALAKRGVTPDTARAFGLGFAPDSRGKLRAALKDYGDGSLVEAGLLIKVDGKEPYDRFRGRLMIPIRDPRGRPIAFGGRVIGEGEPKYLNSPDTPLFDKGRTLYNLDRAAAASRKSGRVFVVEGYMDVIALAQAGIAEAVAPLGTALTEAQLERLWRMVDVPTLCFDGDAAGQKAALRAAHRALPMLGPGRSLCFLTLPAGLDPDDLVRTKGRDAFEALLSDRQPLVDRLWQAELAAEPLDTPEQRAGLRERLRTLAHTIGDAGVRAEYLATFNQRVWDYFHPEKTGDTFRRFKKAETTRRPQSDRLAVIAAEGINEATFVPALWKGLLRYPDLIAPLAEILVRIPTRAKKLRITREALLDAALREPRLESEQARAILRAEGRADVLKQMDEEVTLAFSFLSHKADPEASRRDLTLVAEALMTRPELDSEIAEAQDRSADWSDADFVAFSDLLRTKNEIDKALYETLWPEGEPAA